MTPRSCVNVGDDKSDGGRYQREAQQVGEQLPLQKEHPGKAGEAYAREGAEEQHIPPRGEKRVHEDERAQGVGDAAQHGVQGVHDDRHVDIRGRGDKGNQQMPRSWIVASLRLVGHSSGAGAQYRPIARIEEVARQVVVGLVVVAAVVRLWAVEAEHIDVQADGNARKEVQCEHPPSEAGATGRPVLRSEEPRGCEERSTGERDGQSHGRPRAVYAEYAPQDAYGGIAEDAC